MRFRYFAMSKKHIIRYSAAKRPHSRHINVIAMIKCDKFDAAAIWRELNNIVDPDSCFSDTLTTVVGGHDYHYIGLRKHVDSVATSVLDAWAQSTIALEYISKGVLVLSTDESFDTIFENNKL